MNRTAKAAVVAALFLTGATGGAVFQMMSSGAESPLPAGVVHVDPDGKTYGPEIYSYEDGRTAVSKFDYILVSPKLTGGREGYVRRDDLSVKIPPPGSGLPIEQKATLEIVDRNGKKFAEIAFPVAPAAVINGPDGTQGTVPNSQR